MIISKKHIKRTLWRPYGFAMGFLVLGILLLNRMPQDQMNGSGILRPLGFVVCILASISCVGTEILQYLMNRRRRLF